MFAIKQITQIHSWFRIAKRKSIYNVVVRFDCESPALVSGENKHSSTECEHQTKLACRNSFGEAFYGARINCRNTCTLLAYHGNPYGKHMKSPTKIPIRNTIIQQMPNCCSFKPTFFNSNHFQLHRTIFFSNIQCIHSCPLHLPPYDVVGMAPRLTIHQYTSNPPTDTT